MQHFDFSLPSYQYYRENPLVSFLGCSLVKLVLWALGETDVTKELENSVSSNEHVLLIDNIEDRKKYAEFLNPDLIPDIYKTGKSYYNNVNKHKNTQFIVGKLEEKSILNTNKQIAKTIKNLFNSDISPGLVDDDLLKNLPKAYVITVEFDELKDESIIYAERLRKNGVDVKIAYYEDGFHGVVTFVNKDSPNTVALKMVEDLIHYLRENL